MRRPVSRRGIGRHHPLAKHLVANGWSSREARRVLNIVFDVIKDALRRHENVDLPSFGTFSVVRNLVRPYRRWWRGRRRPTEFYHKQFRVEFVPRQEGVPDE